MGEAQPKTFPCKAPTVPAVAFEIIPDRKPWERQRGETAKQYRAFLVYRDLGLGARSIPATARALGLSQRSGQVGAWSSRNRWRERVTAWDAEIERKKGDAVMQAIQAMAKRHAAAAEDNIEALMEPAREIARRLKDPECRDLEDLPTAHLLLLAVKCACAIPNLMRAERLARGEPAAFAEHGDPVPDYAPDVFQRIDRYTAVFERVLQHRVETPATGSDLKGNSRHGRRFAGEGFSGLNHTGSL